MTAIINKNSITFDDGPLIGQSFHSLWLRERLSDDKSLDKINKQRLYEPSLLKHNIEIIKYSHDETTLTIIFNDGTTGIYIIEELLNEINQYDVIIEKNPWQNKTFKLPYHNYEIFKDSLNLTIDMLTDFHSLGYVIITDLSKKEDTVVNFAESLGPIRSTNFGKFFDVISKSNPNDLAYTGLSLSAHTDNPYRKPVPGIQLLHCISNETPGGDSTLVDGLAISNYLEKNYKKYFEILTSTEILFYFTDKDIILKNWGSLIELNNKKKFKQIRFSGRLDYVPPMKVEKLNIFYKARKKFFQLCASKDFKIQFRLEAGMLIMFDNHRLLHGRTKFNSSLGIRKLQGCYIEHDATEGKLRKLLSS